MERIRRKGHNRVFFAAIAAFTAISIVALALIVVSIVLQSASPLTLSAPMQWLSELDALIAFQVVSNAAELLAAILAIAITVVAIIVELAANRYSHRITSMFVREPVNIIVMSFFVIATIQSVWISLTVDEGVDTAIVPNAGFLISMVMVTVSLIALLPYFAFVLSFLSPVSVIDKIMGSAFRSLETAEKLSIANSKESIRNRIDELQDIARRASEIGDRAVAMASIDALSSILQRYQDRIHELPEEWFKISAQVAKDPDFVSLSTTSIRHIEATCTWLDVKIMRQYLSLVSNGVPNARDITNLVAINTKQIAIRAIERRPELVKLCIRCFNSYLRATINNKDQRTSYYIMNQYRQLAEELLEKGSDDLVQEIALHFQFYGLLGFKLQMPFLLEVAAYDVVHLIETCARYESKIVDQLLDLILELDQEIKEESHEESLLGIRRAQIQLAAYFLGRGDESRAMRISRDLRAEQPERLDRVRKLLLSENRPHYWEFTDRGVNFSYLEPELRQHLSTVFQWIFKTDDEGTDQ